MSEFRCEVVRISIEAHPNADSIEIAKIGDYQSIVRKGIFKDGDLAVYIPEQAVVPEWLLKDMGLWDAPKNKGHLAGGHGNRVKAIKLRGILSQGLIYPTQPYSETEVLVTSEPHGGNQGSGIVEIGGDASECLGIKKYEPTLPSHMRGRVVGVDYDATAKYDFDNLKKTPKLFNDGEEVVITEKIHGTLIQIGVVPESQTNAKYYEGRVVISSKGMGAKGYVLDHNDETNIYAQAAKQHNLLEGMLRVFGDFANKTGNPVFLFGEVFGKTTTGGDIQEKFTYTGLVNDFRAFDIAVGNRGVESYLDWTEFEICCNQLGVYHVPLLYRGPYSKEVVLEHTDGQTVLLPPIGEGHIREGVVVKSADESRNPHYGRKIAKSVSEAYLLRKSGTEYN